jgi:cyclase
MLSLKRSLRTVLVAVLALSALYVHSAQQSRPQAPPLIVEKVRGDIYMVKGGMGANTGLFITDKGVLAIDAKMTADASKQEMAEIAKLTSQPVSIMILTHSDGDHVNGLNGFPPGITVYAHLQTKKDMEAAFQDPALQALKAYLPTLTFSDSGSVTIGGQTVDLLHFGPAHTSGDAVVYFPKDKVAFVGDLVFLGRDPLIHLKKGGSSFGLVKTLQAILKLDADVFVPGHGDPLGKPQIEALVKSIQDRQAKVQALAAEGKTLEDVKKAFNINDAAAPGRRWPSLVEIIYQELTEKK